MSPRAEQGQAAVLALAFMTALLAMAAFVLDVGAWFRADRAVQATADAAALAGAQALPDDAGRAAALAHEYATKNGGELTTEDVSFASRALPSDTIRVHLERSAPGFFTQIFGLRSVRVGATAAARVAPMQAARWVAPIVVHIDHPALHCGGTQRRPIPCFGQPTEIDLLDLHQPGSGNAAGAFGLIDLSGSGGGNAGASTLAAWVLEGYDRFMPLGSYDSAPSSNFNNVQFQGALDRRMQSTLLFPIYDRLTQSGSGAIYNVIGWVGFNLTDSYASGNTGWVRGSFTRVYWEGIQSQSGAVPDFGAFAIHLIE